MLMTAAVTTVIGSFSGLPTLTLVLAGEDDPITPPFYSEQMVVKLPAHPVRFERFANAGHGIAVDAPDRYFKVLREFIAS